MDLYFFENNHQITPKATIHKTGKMGFNSSAAKIMALSQGLKFKIGKSNVDGDDSIYLVSTKNSGKGVFKIQLSGKYFFINTKPIINDMGFSFREKIVFKIELFPNDKDLIYKLTTL